MRSIFLILLLSISSRAFADDNSHSQFFWQADANKSYLTLTYEHDNTKSSYWDQSNENIYGELYHVQYEYGITDNFDLGISETVVDLTDVVIGQSSTKNQGLSDVDITFKATQPIGPVGRYNLKYGFDLYLPAGRNEFRRNGDTNNYTGCTILNPYLGLEIKWANIFAGFRVSTDIGLSQTKVSVDAAKSNDTITGGNQIRANFYVETNYSSGQIGTRLEFLETTDEVDQTFQTTTHVPTVRSIFAYGTYVLNKRTTFTAEVGLSSLQATASDLTQQGSFSGTQSGSDTNYKLGARFEF